MPHQDRGSHCYHHSRSYCRHSHSACHNCPSLQRRHHSRLCRCQHTKLIDQWRRFHRLRSCYQCRHIHPLRQAKPKLHHRYSQACCRHIHSACHSCSSLHWGHHNRLCQYQHTKLIDQWRRFHRQHSCYQCRHIHPLRLSKPKLQHRYSRPCCRHSHSACHSCPSLHWDHHNRRHQNLRTKSIGQWHRFHHLHSCYQYHHIHPLRLSKP